MSTALSALSTSATVLSTAIDQTALDLYADFELVHGTSAAAAADSLVEMYLVRSVDGSNYEDTSTEGRPRYGFVGGFALDNVTSTQRLMIGQVQLPPIEFKVMLLNGSSVTLASSSYITPTLKAYCYRQQVTT